MSSSCLRSVRSPLLSRQSGVCLLCIGTVSFMWDNPLLLRFPGRWVLRIVRIVQLLPLREISSLVLHFACRQPAVDSRAQKCKNNNKQGRRRPSDSQEEDDPHLPGRGLSSVYRDLFFYIGQAAAPAVPRTMGLRATRVIHTVFTFEVSFSFFSRFVRREQTTSIRHSAGGGPSPSC